MTTNPVVSPVYALRFYAWAVLKANMPDIWDEAKYGGLVPVVPLAEEPDLAEFSGPKVIYEYTITDSREPYRGRGSFSMAVLDTNFRRLTETLNILEHAFNRYDESARDINRFVQASTLTGQGVGFGYTTVSFVDGGKPETTEAGNQVGVINITFDYFVDYDVITDVLPTT